MLVAVQGFYGNINAIGRRFPGFARSRLVSGETPRRHSSHSRAEAICAQGASRADTWPGLKKNYSARRLMSIASIAAKNCGTGGVLPVCLILRRALQR